MVAVGYATFRVRVADGAGPVPERVVTADLGNE